MNPLGQQVGREEQRFTVAERQDGAVVADPLEAPLAGNSAKSFLRICSINPNSVMFLLCGPAKIVKDGGSRCRRSRKFHPQEIARSRGRLFSVKKFFGENNTFVPGMR